MSETEYVWKMGANGEPYHEYLAELPEAPLKQPYPKAVWRIKDGRPYHDFLLPLAETPLAKPYPKTVWRTDPLVNGGKLFHDLLPIPEPLGAFRNAKHLTAARIPESVKKIGTEAFRYTALEKVKIASDCEYSETSFPERCKVEFYGRSGAYAQLYDCNGNALLDCESARIYVKKQEDQ